MFNSQEQLLSSIAELVEDTIITVNPNPKIYKDSNGNPLIGGTQYTDSDLEETLTVVWALNDTIYMAIKEKKILLCIYSKRV